MWYTIEALERAGYKRVGGQAVQKKDRKKIEKSFEKPLDKRKTMCYNNKAVQQQRFAWLRQIYENDLRLNHGWEVRQRTWSLKIEQQDEFVLSKR
ncbi:MAG: hypothetical protein IJX47_07310 [Clostridia bacterium]|nr:hypothetical protein [Clostridia bacterium]